MYWYVLFTRTGREHKVEILLKEWLNTNLFVPFIPLHEILFKISGVIKKEIKPLFPGYVFVESEASGKEFIKSMGSLRYHSQDYIQIVRYSDTEIAMRESEKSMLQYLCNDDHCIESSSGIMVGDNICITDGPLKGREGILGKVNRHKRQAWIEIEIMGEIRLVSVALEIIDKAIFYQV